VDPGPLGTVLEGEFRPGHFRGVLTVVAKLLGLARPDVAVFGEKDYQQLVLVRRMVTDLCLGVRIVGAETVREPDGLALSSRNRFLDGTQREEASVLSRALRAGQRDAGRGPAAALGAARAELRRVHAVDLDYLAVTDPDLGPAPARGDGRMLIAARVGSTRLIDNVPLRLGTGPGTP
jgi:pantoate--beta-alanine ligase